jgi:hypothetical protein
MAHKAECAKTKDPNAACNCGEDKPTTRKCWGCDETVGVSEKECPKCKLDFALADEEDNVVERAWARLKKKRDALKGGKPDPKPDPKPAPVVKAHPFRALSKLVGGK